MKKLLKILGILVALVLVGIVAVVGWVVMKWPPTFPDTPTPDITASDDPAVIARGEYLYHAVAHCGACHAAPEEYVDSRPGDKLLPKGGFEWQMGPLGTVRAANITQDDATGIGKYTDGQLARALRRGVGADDRGLLFMFAVGPMSDEDLTALVSYLRTIPPVSNEIPPSDVRLLGKMLFQGPMGFFATPHEFEIPEFVRESELPSVERGRYLAQGPAFCAGCHTNYKYEGEIVFDGPAMSGCYVPFPDETEPGMEFIGPNLTPDPETGHITSWTKDDFMTRFRSVGRIYPGSPMPWETYANLTDADLESVWLYLRSLPPTKKDMGPVYRERGGRAE